MEKLTAETLAQELTELFTCENHVKNDDDSVSVWCALKDLATLSDVVDVHGAEITHVGRSAFEGDVYITLS